MPTSDCADEQADLHHHCSHQTLWMSRLICTILCTSLCQWACWSWPLLLAPDFGDELTDLHCCCLQKTSWISRLICICHSLQTVRMRSLICSIVHTSLCDKHVDLHLHCQHQTVQSDLHLCHSHQTVRVSRRICTFVGCTKLREWAGWSVPLLTVTEQMSRLIYTFCF